MNRTTQTIDMIIVRVSLPINIFINIVNTAANNPMYKYGPILDKSILVLFPTKAIIPNIAALIRKTNIIELSLNATNIDENVKTVKRQFWL